MVYWWRLMSLEKKNWSSDLKHDCYARLQSTDECVTCPTGPNIVLRLASSFPAQPIHLSAATSTLHSPSSTLTITSNLTNGTMIHLVESELKYQKYYSAFFAPIVLSLIREGGLDIGTILSNELQIENFMKHHCVW